MNQANPNLEIEKKDQLDTNDNLALDEHSDLHALCYTTAAALVIVSILIVFTMLLSDWRPRGHQIDAVVLIWLLAISAPIMTAGFIHGRRAFWYDRHRRKILYWTEQRMRRDIDGDGSIGVVLHDNSWFVRSVRHWFDGGSTTFEASQRSLGITLSQWRAARLAVIESGIGVAVGRQGGGQGFVIKERSWNDVLVKMPMTPQVYEEEGTQQMSHAFARDNDQYGPVATSPR